MINFAYVRQGEPLGLGHAVLVTRDLVGDEPFAVILADDVIDADPPALKQMIDVFERVGGPVLAVERVPREDDLELRRHRRRADGGSRRRASTRSRPRREAAARRGAVGPGDHRPLHPHARHLPGARGDQERPHRRDPADQRPARAAEVAADLRLRGQGRPPRHRQQARIPEGGRVLRAAAAGSGRAVLAPTSRRSDCRRPSASASATPLGAAARDVGVDGFVPSRLDDVLGRGCVASRTRRSCRLRRPFALLGLVACLVGLARSCSAFVALRLARLAARRSFFA